jgi:molybdenum cofactor cytidylyltransferase
MGYPKALLPLGKGTFLTHILEKIGQLDLPETLVVVGRDAPKILPLTAGFRVRMVINDAPDRGQLSSLHLALERLTSTCDGCLVWPVDLPLVSKTLVGDLIRLFRHSEALVVMPQCGNRKGHPAIFHRELFRELLETAPEKGAKGVISSHQRDTVLLPTQESSAVEDIDTPEDYRRLTGTTVEAAVTRRERELEISGSPS